MGCLKLTYYPETELKTVNAKKELTLKISSKTLRSSYLFGFNGKENDNEVKGDGGQQDYGERIYDPRLCRFLSTDPIEMDYPELTPYQFASNRPIDGIDLDGLEFVKKNGAILYIPPTPGRNGCSTCPMSAIGSPSEMLKNGSTTTLHTISFKQTGNNFQPIHSITKFEKAIQSVSLKVGTPYKLKNGGTVTLTKFNPITFTEGSAKYLALKIKLNYQNNSGQNTGSFLQSIKRAGNNSMYDGTEGGSNPLYADPYIKNTGRFQDSPADYVNKTPNTSYSFQASLVIYEKQGDTFNAVGQLDYSFTIKYDSKGKGKMSKFSQKFTDLSKSNK